MGCFNSVKPRVLELLTLVFTVVAIGFLIWGIIDIPWDDISTAGKIFYYIGCVFVVLVLLFLLVLMCLRIGNKINGPRNGAGICLCITMMVCEILAIIIFVIAEIIIFVNMGDKDDEYWDNPDNFCLYSIHGLAERFPNIIPLLHSPVGTAYFGKKNAFCKNSCQKYYGLKW